MRTVAGALQLERQLPAAPDMSETILNNTASGAALSHNCTWITVPITSPLMIPSFITENKNLFIYLFIYCVSLWHPIHDWLLSHSVIQIVRPQYKTRKNTCRY